MLKFLLLFSVGLLSAVCATAQLPLLTRLAFGSCGEQDDPHPILDSVRRHRPDAFVFLGDNIYGDTDDMAVLRAKYGQLAAKPEFQRLKKATRVLATWDDHDFGRNDAGRHYPCGHAVPFQYAWVK